MEDLSAITQTPLEKGERVSVFFPPQGINRGWDAYGKVIRCDASTMGYRVAMEFDPLPAAAAVINRSTRQNILGPLTLPFHRGIALFI